MEEQADRLGTKIGMWLFLYTEIMLFGGLFVVYANYYHRYTADFVQGGQSLSTITGAVNTASAPDQQLCGRRFDHRAREGATRRRPWRSWERRS